MNIAYLDTLPEAENKYIVALEQGEKVIFTAELDDFGTEYGESLSIPANRPFFTMTNKSIRIDNGLGVWSVNIAEDVVSCEKCAFGIFIKIYYFKLKLNKTINYYSGKHKRRQKGFQFYFNKEDTPRFEEIVKHLFR